MSLGKDRGVYCRNSLGEFVSVPEEEIRDTKGIGPRTGNFLVQINRMDLGTRQSDKLVVRFSQYSQSKVIALKFFAIFVTWEVT